MGSPGVSKRFSLELAEQLLRVDIVLEAPIVNKGESFHTFIREGYRFSIVISHCCDECLPADLLDEFVPLNAFSTRRHVKVRPV